MDNNQIVSKMNTYIHMSSESLSGWLGKMLPKTSSDWWEECVLDNLSYNQREIALNKSFSKLDDFDLAALLRIADKSWFAMRNIAYLPNDERDCVRDMMRVRNNWAHVGATLPGKDAILADLTTIQQFLGQLGRGYDVTNEIGKVIEDIKATSSADFEVELSTEAPEEEPETAVSEDDIQEKSVVYLKGDPDTHGIVMSITDMGDTKKYDVFVNGNFQTYYSGQIALFVEKQDVVPQGMDVGTFRSHLTAYQINNPSGGDLYSLNSARIDFVPYQFRPALKLIHADEPRLLIADSVGVGKTIEAGLIIKELQARDDIESVMIICPKPLVTERKWEVEMKRFDEEFVPVDGPMLRQVISDTDRDGEWPIRFNKVIVPYSILDSRTYEGESKKGKHSYGLRDLDPAPHFDLVIVDEAHHIRNGSMEKEKAFEYKCVKYFCDNADAVVMLTATPLQTGDDDLYTLLNVLRPDVVIDKETFDMMARPNAKIFECAKIMRKADPDWQEQADIALKGVLETQWGETVIANNPVFKDVMNTLQKNDLSREERVNLISMTENLHSFNTLINRTRRKDIQDFCTRRPYTVSVEFTPAQKELHDELLAFEQEALAELHGDVRSIPFMMSTIKRQAASCIFGLAPHIMDLVNRRFKQMEDDPDSDGPEFDVGSENASVLSRMAQNLLILADDLPEEDPKYDNMLDIIRKKQKDEKNKIIIFSTFRFTLRYLNEKLTNDGFRVGMVDGGVKDAMRQELRHRFELPRDNNDALDIMLFTEVGSEGLDYQFCDMMINYDLPWNPMRIEQRIGRIDRRGQESDVVSIYNMVTEETVDADIYHRCLFRIGVFQSSIGECDEILGDIADQIEKIAYDSSLTEDERKQKLEQMADNEVRKIQEMNKLEDEERESFGLDISEFTTSQEVRNAENPWLNPRNIQTMIEQYINERVGHGSYIIGEGNIKQLRLSADARFALRDDLKNLSVGRNAVKQRWDAYLKGKAPLHTVVFDSESAEKDRDAFFITAMHPLARQAAAYFSAGDVNHISLRYVSDDVKAGKYHFSVYAWKYVGLSPRFRMVVVCDDDSIVSELPQIIQESQSDEKLRDYQSSDWDALEKKQIDLWMKEKQDVLANAESTSSFKIESLSNNFRNQKRSLEGKILDTNSESIKRMYMGEMEAAEEKYRIKMKEIRDQVEKTDIHSTLIANGILEVVN